MSSCKNLDPNVLAQNQSTVAFATPCYPHETVMAELIRSATGVALFVEFGASDKNLELLRTSAREFLTEQFRQYTPKAQ